MAFSEALAERIRQRLDRRKSIEEKKMFGGVGFLLNGNLLVGVWKDSLIVRLGPDEGDEALKEPHVAVDVGKLEQARLLEPWAMLWISLAFRGGMGRDFGFALLRRGKPNPTA